MEYTVKALADLAGVTPRTLRWYDRTGLLKPLRTTEAGYRLYGPKQLDRLQDILFYRELGLDLASIRTILDDPAFDRQAALQSHLAELEARRARLDDLILTVQRTINDIKGGTKMTDQEKFEAFKRRTVEANETAFGQEIREKYGDEEMDRANACVLALTQEEYAQWKSLGGEIHTALVTAVKAGADPAGPEGQRIAALHRRWLSYSWESYTPQAHVGLAELYVSDPRFTAYYDREVRKGNWPKCQYLLPPDVRELTLGLYGFGLAGRHLHDIFHNGFGTKVISCDPYISDAVKAQYPDVEFVSFEELITRSDIISIHVVLTPETTHVFNKEVFKKMKNTAMIINTSRGPVIDNDDMVWALQNGEILYAGLDTVEREPLPENDPLKTLDNVIVNPHCGSYGVGSKKTQIQMVCDLVPTAVTTGKVAARCVADRDVLNKETGFTFI